MSNPHHALGMRAENAAAQWLTARGWRVVARRWRSPAGEIDLVCLDGAGTLVAVEVKLRRSARAGTAVEALDRRRLARLRGALADYARQAGAGTTGLRIDLVTAAPEGSRWRLARLSGVDSW